MCRKSFGGRIVRGYPRNCLASRRGSRESLVDGNSVSTASGDFAIVTLLTDASKRFSSTFSGRLVFAMTWGSILFSSSCFGSVSRRILWAVRGTFSTLKAKISLSLSILFNLLMSVTVQLNLKAIEASVSFSRISASRVCTWRILCWRLLSVSWISLGSSSNSRL